MVLNLYGDLAPPGSGPHGADIAVQRLDALDRAALVAALALPPRSVCVDLGCGAGLQGLRLASLGHEAHLYDLHAEPPPLVAALRGQAALALHYHPGDLAEPAPRAQLPACIALAYSQRFIHYLPQPLALELLRDVAARLLPGGLFFLSASGLDSELGQGYAHRDRPLAQRHARLAPALRQRHGIQVAVCLYTEAELQALAARAGLACRSIERSAFGNVKAVLQRPAAG